MYLDIFLMIFDGTLRTTISQGIEKRLSIKQYSNIYYITKYKVRKKCWNIEVLCHKKNLPKRQINYSVVIASFL